MPAVYRVSWLFEGKSELLSLIVKQETGANNIGILNIILAV